MLGNMRIKNEKTLLFRECADEAAHMLRKMYELYEAMPVEEKTNVDKSYPNLPSLDKIYSEIENLNSKLGECSDE